MGFANSIISWKRQANCVSGARQSFKDRVSRLCSLSPALFLIQHFYQACVKCFLI